MAPGGLVTVDFTTIDGTATVADQDFDGVSGTLAFGASDSVRVIDVIVHGDARLEGNEWFRVRLSNPDGLRLADSAAVGTITNDERATFDQSALATTDYHDGTLPSAWGDFNADGYLDLPLFWGGPSPPFTEMPGFRTLLAQGNYHGASSCDYDRDGDLDLVILGYALGERLTPDLLLQNQGDGTFINVAPALGMAVTGNGETAGWGDFDGDSWPDLFTPYFTDLPPYQSFLYRNNGDGTFTERAADAGISAPGAPWALRPEGAHGADWNDDGYLDLYCATSSLTMAPATSSMCARQSAFPKGLTRDRHSWTTTMTGTWTSICDAWTVRRQLRWDTDGLDLRDTFAVQGRQDAFFGSHRQPAVDAPSSPQGLPLQLLTG